MCALMLSGCASPKVDYLSVPKAPSYLKKNPKKAPDCIRVTVRDLAVCEKKKDQHIKYLNEKARAQAAYIRQVERVKGK